MSMLFFTLRNIHFTVGRRFLYRKICWKRQHPSGHSNVSSPF